MAIVNNQPFRHVPGLLYLTNNGIYSGSYRGMRFRLISAEEKIKVTIWPEPWCIEKTPEEEQQNTEFVLSEEGLTEAKAWLEQQYAEQYPRWEAVRRNHDL